ncbi:MAG: PTS sugar transporter subunit IIA [Rickettsiales bacterium]|nr:PTS sugar transporter subunit IIA [Rickettsiales bacterium]
MNISELIDAKHVWLDEEATCPKQVFRMVAERVADEQGIAARDIIDGLAERERLGTTAVGDGIAIPHARFAGLRKVVGIFVRLKSPIDMDAVDDRNVDLLFCLLAPEDANAEHLKVLARVARMMRSSDNQMILRENDSSEAVLSVLFSEDDA